MQEVENGRMYYQSNKHTNNVARPSFRLPWSSCEIPRGECSDADQSRPVEGTATTAEVGAREHEVMIIRLNPVSYDHQLTHLSSTLLLDTDVRQTCSLPYNCQQL